MKKSAEKYIRKLICEVLQSEAEKKKEIKKLLRMSFDKMFGEYNIVQTGNIVEDSIMLAKANGAYH